MKTMKMNFLLAGLICTMLFTGCNKEDEKSTAPTTDFDVTTVTNKKYKPGDIVEADIRIDTKGFLTDGVQIDIVWSDSNNEFIDSFKSITSDITPTKEPFTYHLEYEIPAEVNSGDKVRLTLSTNRPEESAAPTVLQFTLEIE